METLEFRLLGGAEIRRNGRIVTGIGLQKARALLYYLVTTEQMHSRSTLAGLLWGGLPEANARRNLRKVLTRLRRSLGDYLLITRQTVTMRPDVDSQVDVTQFQKLVKAQGEIEDRQTALALYQGDFLDGFFVHEAPEFEHWVLGQRARLRDEAMNCLQQTVQHLIQERDDGQAISYTKRMLELEPWREESHRLLMSLYARAGQVASAIAQYEMCRQILVTELGIEPSSETQQLLIEIQAEAQAEIRVGFRQQHVQQSLAVPSNLPQVATAFIGREIELNELRATLQNPTTRLLTIVGMGGVGKTRLALALASQLADDEFPDGRYFCSFEALHFSDAHDEKAVRATVGLNILASMKLTPSPRADPFQELLDYLHQRQLLLILDNFESLLLPDLVPIIGKLVQEILTQSAQVKLLLTSRQPLYLRAEWLYDIGGLPLPQAGEGEADSVASVRLFNETARRLNRHFDTHGEGPTVQQICRLVGGLPLGIELAAGLIREKRCTEIASQIAQSLDGITTKWHDLPPRQRSLKATFEYTWSLLPKPEQLLLSRLAYMRRGLSHEAAGVVVGHLTPLLDNLALKSLVQSKDERYYLHEVIIEFARQKLESVPEWLNWIAENHAHYFLKQLKSVEHSLEKGEDYPLCQTLRPDLENVRLAWRWASERGAFDLLNQAAIGLRVFFYSMGWLSEGIALLEGAVQALRPPQTDSLPTLVNCLLQQGVLVAASTERDRAAELAALSAQYLDTLASQKNDAAVMFLQAEQQYLQGYIAHGNNDWSTARMHLAQAAETFHRLKRTFDEAKAYFVIGNGWMGERQWGKVTETNERVIALCREIGNVRQEAKALATMAVAYSAENRLEEARRCREQAQELSADIMWPVREEVVWLGMAAEQALDAGYLDEAASHIEQAAALVVQSGSMFYEDWNHIQHGHLLLQIGEYEAALGHYERAQACTVSAENPPMIAFALLCLCLLHYRWGKAALLGQNAQALSEVIAQTDGEYYEARAASWTGFALLASNQAGKAEPNFLQALAVTTDEVCLCEARWGLMLCYQQQGNQTAAYETAAVLIASPLFENLPMMVTEILLPFQIYYDCWQTLRLVEPLQAKRVLQMASSHLHDRLHRIENPAWKDAYLQEVTLQGKFPVEAA